ncbi:MAG: 3-oxoacyl-[acyl-carrier-protein] synthase 3 [Owenweeksia sp. TMED14]|nr:MAG: 3-oxoacyl-[acyl-carrier-protein] synthase 3 [Owenweeksia sp. TMED14]
MNNVEIIGTGSYVPPHIRSNEFFEKVGSSDQWIKEKLGIHERRIALDETTSDLASKAAIKAIRDANLSPIDIDLIVVATATPDRQAPSCACFVQKKIKAINAVAFDISAVCSGALYAVCTAMQFVKTGVYKNVLVIGADTFSTITDWSRRDSVFFGDGAGAIVLSGTNKDKGFIDFSMHTDSVGLDHFTIPGGGAEQPSSLQTIDSGSHFWKMDGQEIYKTAIDVLPKSINKLLEKNKLSIEDIHCLLPHQPSIRILKDIAASIGMPFERVKTNMDRYANTSGGTIPIVLDEVRKGEGFKPGEIVLMASIGAGMTWATALYKW